MSALSNRFRMAAAILIAPVIYIPVWSYQNADHPAFWTLVVINSLFFYVSFIVFAGISHIVLKTLGRTRLWQYCAAVFFVASAGLFSYSALAVKGSESLLILQTQVVEKSEITGPGYLFFAGNSLKGGAFYAFCVAVFWLIACWGRNSSGDDKA